MMREARQQFETAPHVVIVGGGISGLSAAWYLEQQAKDADLNVRYSVLEASPRWGGKILTETVPGFAETPFVVEAGPDSFMTQKPWALQLAREVGLEDRLLGTNDEMRNVYVLNRGRLAVLPEGVFLIVPTKFMPFARSPLISWRGKLRMGLDWFIPARSGGSDETLASFVSRRLGNEALDKIAEPLMSGIYNAEADRQSLLATFPRFRQLEQDHGSLIRGMLASQRSQRKASAASLAPRVSAFMSLRSGTQELVDALTERLTGDLRLNVRVEELNRAATGQYSLRLSTGETLQADAVILTTPAYTTAKLVRGLAPSAAEKLTAIRYVSTGTVSLAFHASDVQSPLRGFGLVIPRSEHRPINAITISSTKFDNRAPDGCVLLRAFFGGSRTPESMAYDDEQLLAVVMRELETILGMKATPLFHRIYRWHQANPQYDVGHLDQVAAIEAALPQGLYVTGSAYRGVGMPDCVYQAKQTVTRVFAAVQRTETTV